MSEALSCAGYRGAPVPNEFVRYEGETEHLALLLPGLGYTCDMPLFYYAENVFLGAGADVLRVEYDYRRIGWMDLSETERRERLRDDAWAATQAGLAQREYRRVTLVGKSLGTLAMGFILPDLAPTDDLQLIWLTPVLRDDVVAGIRRFAESSLVVIGTGDPYFEPDVLERLRDAGAEVLTIEGADHSIDVPGDPVASVWAVGRVVEAMRRVGSNARQRGTPN